MRNAVFLSVAHLILPWLTPRELATVSATCTALHHLATLTSAARSADASRSMEPFPIPFINTTIDSPSPSPSPSHPTYAFFIYSPSLITPPNPPIHRHFWGSNPNPNPNPQFKLSDFSFGDSGCDCVGEGEGEGKGDCGVADECPCSAIGFECGPGCGCGSGCANRRTQSGVSVRLNVVRVCNKGWGLFADQFISSAEFVCEYAGELLTTQEARRRQKSYDELTRRNSNFCSALLVVREFLPSRKACFRINIDATNIGNVARFINHSCDGGNLDTVLVRSSGSVIPRVCFFTSRDVNAGEELSFSYGDVRLRPQGLPCSCRSSNCCGTLPSEHT